MMAEFKNDPKNKRYYWLKLKNDFFDQKEIKMLRRIAGGDTYTIIYLKMLLKSLKDDGKLFYEAIGDNFSEELALDIDEDIENVQVTLNYLEKKGLLEIVEEDEYFLNRVPEMIGSESFSAERVRRHRKKQALQCNRKVLQSDNDVTECNGDVTKRKEQEKRAEKKEKIVYIETEQKQEQDLDLDLYPLKKSATASPPSQSKISLGVLNTLEQSQEIEQLERLCDYFEFNIEEVGKPGRAQIKNMVKSLNYELVDYAIKMTLPTRIEEREHEGDPIRSPLAYLQTIINDWRTKRFTTIEDVETHEEDSTDLPLPDRTNNSDINF